MGVPGFISNDNNSHKTKQGIPIITQHAISWLFVICKHGGMNFYFELRIQTIIIRHKQNYDTQYNSYLGYWKINYEIEWPTNRKLNWFPQWHESSVLMTCISKNADYQDTRNTWKGKYCGMSVIQCT